MKSKLHPVHIGVSLCILAVLLLAANIAFGTVSIPLSEVFSAITAAEGIPSVLSSYSKNAYRKHSPLSRQDVPWPYAAL